jgi:hypothetical protein
LKSANIYGAKDAPSEFVRWALQHGAVSMSSDADWSRELGEK